MSSVSSVTMRVRPSSRATRRHAFTAARNGVCHRIYVQQRCPRRRRRRAASMACEARKGKLTTGTVSASVQAPTTRERADGAGDAGASLMYACMVSVTVSLCLALNALRRTCNEWRLVRFLRHAHEQRGRRDVLDVGKATTERLPTAYMLAMCSENNSVLHTHVCCVLSPCRLRKSSTRSSLRP